MGEHEGSVDVEDVDFYLFFVEEVIVVERQKKSKSRNENYGSSNGLRKPEGQDLKTGDHNCVAYYEDEKSRNLAKHSNVLHFET